MRQLRSNFVFFIGTGPYQTEIDDHQTLTRSRAVLYKSGRMPQLPTQLAKRNNAARPRPLEPADRQYITAVGSERI